MTLPKLNLRELFWLVIVVALTAAWWAEKTGRARDAELVIQRQLQAEIDEQKAEHDRLKPHFPKNRKDRLGSKIKEKEAELEARRQKWKN
jgi:hypothetical protein